MAICRRLHAATAVLVTVLSSPVANAGFPGADLFLPMVGRQAGVHPSNWFTTVWIHNPGAEAATARIYLLERGTSNPSPPWVDVLVGAGDTEALENIVESLFHKEVFGALRVTCDSQKLVVTSRVYSNATGADDKDSVGQDFAGVPASFAIGLHEAAQVLGVHQTVPSGSSDFRFNFGFVETTGHTVTVRVTAFDGNKANQGFKDFQVREFSQRQVAFKDHFPAVSTENARLEVEVISGAGEVIAYGSGIANGSQDPTTFEMTYADALLAQTTPPGVGGSGSAGQVAFWSDAAALSGSSSLFWDSGAGRLGIGTSAPAQQLDLTGNLHLPATAAAGSAGALFLGDGRFLHAYGPGAAPGNTFLGRGAGNLTMGGADLLSGTGNTATGASSLSSNTTGFWNTAIGAESLSYNTTGSRNTASGHASLNANTAGTRNTAVGSESLPYNTTGSRNTAVGSESLYLNTTGDDNTATGASSLAFNNTGSFNTANGVWSLFSNTTGSYNTASGHKSLYANTAGLQNTAIGSSSLLSNTLGMDNTAIGFQSLNSNTTGGANTASGRGSLASNTTGGANTASGMDSLSRNTTGYYNTASGSMSLYLNTTGYENTASGSQSLYHNTTGYDNTASGYLSLRDNTTGRYNTATGSESLNHNTSGIENTAAGFRSLSQNTTGLFNTANGSRSLATNTTGYSNTASGAQSLAANTTGYSNTASGARSLDANTTGNENTAIGSSSLFENTTGYENTASGVESLQSNTTGYRNTASGKLSLASNTTGHSNTAAGRGAGDGNVTGSGNTFLGDLAQPYLGDLDNATAIGFEALVHASDQVRIGNTNVTQIGGQVAWSNLSDARHKSSIRDLDLGRDFVLALRPVSFTVNGGDGRTDMGFLAQDVEALLGKGYGVLGIGGDPERTLSLRYTDLIAPLVKTVQEQQALIEELLARVASLERAMR